VSSAAKTPGKSRTWSFGRDLSLTRYNREVRQYADFSDTRFQ
jgi:hypothetical protein